MALIRASSARKPLTLRIGEAFEFDRPFCRGSCRGLGAARLASPPAFLFVRTPSSPGLVPMLALAEPPATPAPPAALGDCSSGIGNSTPAARRRWRPDQLPSKRLRTADSIGQISVASLSMK